MDLISAGTLAEVLIVAARRNITEEVSRLIDGLGFEVVSVCFAYEVAQTHGCRLIYVGGDFSRSGIPGVF